MFLLHSSEQKYICLFGDIRHSYWNWIIVIIGPVPAIVNVGFYVTDVVALRLPLSVDSPLIFDQSSGSIIPLTVL